MVATAPRPASRVLFTPALATVGAFLAGPGVDPRDLPWRDLDARDLRLVRAWLSETYPPPTVQSVLLSLRRAVRCTSQEASGAPDQAIERTLTPAELRAATRSRSRSFAARLLTLRAERSLLDACDADDSAAGRRDAAVIALMLKGGLRRGEVASLQSAGFDDAQSLLTLRPPSGRGVRRALALTDAVASLLEAWQAARGTSTGPLFEAVDPSGNATGAPMTASAVNRLVARRANEAGLARLTPHDLRQAYLARLRERVRTSDGVVHARRHEDQDGQPVLLTTALP